jgi:hypothetical protein
MESAWVVHVKLGGNYCTSHYKDFLKNLQISKDSLKIKVVMITSPMSLSLDGNLYLQKKKKKEPICSLVKKISDI